MPGRWARIGKPDARKRCLAGLPVRMCASGLGPDNPWGAYSDISPQPPDFDRTVRGFEYYNCVSRETGRRAAFYIRAE